VEGWKGGRVEGENELRGDKIKKNIFLKKKIGIHLTSITSKNNPSTLHPFQIHFLPTNKTHIRLIQHIYIYTLTMDYRKYVDEEISKFIVQVEDRWKDWERATDLYNDYLQQGYEPTTMTMFGIRLKRNPRILKKNSNGMLYKLKRDA
jgi:hypothetical protein